jgi:hypothetical protein
VDQQADQAGIVIQVTLETVMEEEEDQTVNTKYVLIDD